MASDADKKIGEEPTQQWREQTLVFWWDGNEDIDLSTRKLGQCEGAAANKTAQTLVREPLRSCPSMRWKFGVELERPSVRRPEVELL